MWGEMRGTERWRWGDPVVAGDPTERVGMLLAHPPALSNSEGMGEQEGGE